ncbi:MAG: hypothetical protein KBB50_01400 [Candidatus Pacebacteria bacterium]|nr:hypothetical protein [Candidatus Paceibacterota bacterium]
MISLEQCRKIDPSLGNLTDAELTEIRNALYELGNIAFKTWQNNKFPNFSRGLLQNNNKGRTIINYE